jgi:hypothetical protein
MICYAYHIVYQIKSINKCDDIYYENLNKFFNKDISNIILNYMFKYYSDDPKTVHLLPKAVPLVEWGLPTH